MTLACRLFASVTFIAATLPACRDDGDRRRCGNKACIGDDDDEPDAEALEDCDGQFGVSHSGEEDYNADHAGDIEAGTSSDAVHGRCELI